MIPFFRRGESMEVLKIHNVYKRIEKKQILTNIQLTIAAGEIVGLVGPNGAGKTSLMKLIAGYNLPSEGSIEICGHHVIKDHSSAMSEASFLVESPGLYPNLSGKRHLEMFCDGRGISRDAIHEVGDFIDFESQLSDKVKTYSIGMKQRLALALCWVADPKLLVLDEPVNGLDPDGIMLLREKLQLIASRGSAVLVSSHLLEELQKVTTRIVFINGGEILGEETAEDYEGLEKKYLRYFSNAGKEQ